MYEKCYQASRPRYLCEAVHIPVKTVAYLGCARHIGEKVPRWIDPRSSYHDMSSVIRPSQSDRSQPSLRRTSHVQVCLTWRALGEVRQNSPFPMMPLASDDVVAHLTHLKEPTPWDLPAWISMSGHGCCSNPRYQVCRDAASRSYQLSWGEGLDRGCADAAPGGGPNIDCRITGPIVGPSHSAARDSLHASGPDGRLEPAPPQQFISCGGAPRKDRAQCSSPRPSLDHASLTQSLCQAVAPGGRARASEIHSVEVNSLGGDGTATTATDVAVVEQLPADGSRLSPESQ